MFLVKDWEMFYTDSLVNEDLVDQLSVDVANKRYVLDVGAEIWATDGYDEDDDEICSNYVSRFVFNIIVEGLKQKGFVLIK